MQTVADILTILAAHSRRPRYAFMLLGLMSEVADSKGRVGPHVGAAGQPVRDWLASCLAPVAARDHRRQALLARTRAELVSILPEDPLLAQEIVDREQQTRIIQSGRTNVSRSMSELERAGLVRRHYAGWRTNHEHRGGGRYAVYILHGDALAALRRRAQLL